MVNFLYCAACILCTKNTLLCKVERDIQIQVRDTFLEGRVMLVSVTRLWMLALFAGSDPSESSQVCSSVTSWTSRGGHGEGSSVVQTHVLWDWEDEEWARCHFPWCAQVRSLYVGTRKSVWKWWQDLKKCIFNCLPDMGLSVIEIFYEKLNLKRNYIRWNLCYENLHIQRCEVKSVWIVFNFSCFRERSFHSCLIVCCE